MRTDTMRENLQITQFAKEILDGLRATPKYLPAKYFYDKAGDRIFQEIMHFEEYCPFGCELEILSGRNMARTTRSRSFFTRSCRL